MKIFQNSIFNSSKTYKQLNKIINGNYSENKCKNLKDTIFIFKRKNFIYILIILLLFITSFFLLYKLLIRKSPLYTNLSKYLSQNTYRLAFVFGTRPEAIKLFPLIKELKENKNFTCIIINTGQHKEMIKEIFDSLYMDDIIDFNLDLMKNNQSLVQLTSRIMMELEKIYNLINPNAIIVQGDTTTAFSAAVSAFYQKIPIFHVEAGLRTHNLYYPFPEEFNRISIDDISTLYFAPTDWAANNLLKEYKNQSNIFITGNTIVDSLEFTLKNSLPSKKIKKLIKKSKSLCFSKDNCKIILLTCHRRENYFSPIYNILIAVQELLKNYNDIVIILPFHLNPNVKQSIKNSIPILVYDKIIEGKEIKIKEYLYLNRLLIIPPLNYIDLVHLESESYFLMSDSGGIQEEAVSIGKPILILRDNTERPETVKSGCGFLVGTSSQKIYNYASSLLKNKDLYRKISKPQYIYGKGNSSVIISKIIQNYFENKITKSFSPNLTKKFNDIITKYDNSLLKNNNSNSFNNQKDLYDVVIILTVWKRNNLERQLIQIKNQSILKDKKINIIIFQNSNHININHHVNKWKQSDSFPENVDITFIQSPIETGYFGRFIIPLTSSVGSDSYFIVCDDDVIWGNRYFENMLRVVNEGSLATRNGRIVDEYYKETSESYRNGSPDQQVCYNEDIEYDFGGHIWAGRISWLRQAWNHIPFSFENCEDFWLSAVLKSFYNIPTKIPKCPCPDGNPIIPDLCAASDKSAYVHEKAKVGESSITEELRVKLIKEITIKFNFPQLTIYKPEYVKSIHKKYFFSDNFFNLSDNIWKDVLYWQ